MWHERVSGKCDGLNNKNHVQDVYPATCVRALSPSHCCWCFAVRNFTPTQNSKSPEYWRTKKIILGNCLHSLKWDTQQTFFSHENIGLQDFIAFCTEIHSFQKSWNSFLQSSLILETTYSISKFDLILVSVKSKLNKKVFQTRLKSMKRLIKGNKPLSILKLWILVAAMSLAAYSSWFSAN